MTARPAAERADARRPRGSSAAETERMLVRAAVLYRLFGIAQLWLVIALDLPRYSDPAANLGLALAISAESIAGSVVIMRRGRLIPWMICVDTGVNMAALVAGAALTTPADGHTWIYFMYPFSMIASVGIGLAFRRLCSVLVITACLAGAYVAAAIGLHGDPPWNTLPNAGSYFLNTVVAWAVARYVREAGLRLDAASAEAVDRAATLAAERERLRHARLLHDRVLQTLETLAHGEWIRDPAMRARVSAEAAWVRGLVEGHLPGGDDDLATGLVRLIRDRTERGMQIQFNGTQLRELGDARRCLAPEAGRALIDAAGEALTNVAKHSGTACALMRASVTAERVTVSVIDHGRDFDAAAAPHGVGLRESIQARLREAGGEAHIESAPGAGTFIEMSVPRISVPPQRQDAAAGVPASRAVSSGSEPLDADKTAQPGDQEGTVPATSSAGRTWLPGQRTAAT
jgi:signal transduction histidine kinase